MAKITLTDLANLQNENTAVNAINNNNAAIETAVEKTLSRDGTSPNTMGADFDMNSFRILNLPNATTNQEPATFAQLLLSPSSAAASNITFTPSGSISSTNVQSALQELDTEKAAISSLANVATTGAATDLVTTLGAWTPVFTCATPGDLAITYSSQFGNYVVIGNLVFLQFNIISTAFTFTGAASGSVQITGVPFASRNQTGAIWRGPIALTGYTKAGFTTSTVNFGSNSSNLTISSGGSGVTNIALTISDFVSGTNINAIGNLWYYKA